MIYINDKSLDFGEFGNKESHTEISSEITSELKANESNGISNVVGFKYEDDKDIFHLQLVKNHLDNINIKTCLFMPYVPYSRMDRPIGRKLFSLKGFGNIINHLDFEEVVVFEPHSSSVEVLFNKLKVVHFTKYLVEELMHSIAKENKFDGVSVSPCGDIRPSVFEYARKHNIWLIYPDAGAEKRYSSEIEYEKFLLCSKHRNLNTNRITRLNVNLPAGTNVKGATAIIVDDLCSYGTTFILAAKSLKELGFEKVFLCVSHCEDNILKGDFPSTDVIDGIFTSDSILTKTHPKIHTHKISFGGTDNYDEYM